MKAELAKQMIELIREKLIETITLAIEKIEVLDLDTDVRMMGNPDVCYVYVGLSKSNKVVLVGEGEFGDRFQSLITDESEVMIEDLIYVAEAIERYQAEAEDDQIIKNIQS